MTALGASGVQDFEGHQRLFLLGLVEAVAPGDGGRGLASGMGELDAGGGALAVEEIDDAGERADLSILPQAEIGVGNPRPRG